MSYNIFPNLPGQEWKSKKRMVWDVEVQKSAQKRRKTLISQAYPTWEITVSYVGLTKNNADMIMGFFGQQKAGFEPFLWKDLEDYKCTGQSIAIGTGQEQTAYLVRTIGDGATIPVENPIANTLKLYADGTEIQYTLGDNGAITFTANQGQKITADFEYYWLMAFDNDYNEQTIIYYDIFENASIKLVSSR